MIVGKGAREDALVGAHERSPDVRKIIVAPGNDFIAHDREKEVVLEPIAALDDVGGMLEIADRHQPDIIEIGPEAALAAAATDELRERGFNVFGPGYEAAIIEWDKVYSRRFMLRNDIAAPRFETFGHLSHYHDAARPEEARQYAATRFDVDPRTVLYFKAAGICDGKGALKAGGFDKSIDRISQMESFGGAGRAFVVEDAVEGEEFSYYAVTDGSEYLTFKSAQDNKRSHDGDAGEQTGGMGAVAPALVTEGLEQRIEREQIVPAIEGLAGEERRFEGMLYLGAILTPSGQIINIEYNARWGDPEAQVIVPGIQSDYIELIRAATERGLSHYRLKQDDLTRVCVVGATKGYPGAYETGYEITGLQRASEVEGVDIFGSAVAVRDGRFYNDGGRLFSVVGAGKDVIEAREKAYEAMSYIAVAGDNLHYRTDIGQRDVNRLARTEA